MPRLSVSDIESSSGQERVRNADVVTLIDEEAPSYEEQLSGQHRLARVRDRGQEAYEVKVVEIALDHTKPGDIARAKAAFARATSR